ncbi:MAG: TolC family protein [Alphaproteobacteria bacterium]|nr:TolC family protein [Alphaproteobacteria bacterium]
MPATAGGTDDAMIARHWFRFGVFGAALGLAGCATYHEMPLPQQSNLAPSLAALKLNLPPQKAGGDPPKVDVTKPLKPDEVAKLAVLNDPDLADQRGKIESAQADVLAAKILPNPSVSLGDAFLVYAPPAAGAIADALSASISQDIRSIIQYGPHVTAAEARFHQVGADALWAEWQVAQKARLLAIGINGEDREIALRQHNLALLTQEVTDVQQATAAGNLDLTAEAPLLASLASAQRDLASLQLQQIKDWQELDSMLGLQPTVRFAVAEPEPVTLPKTIDPLVASLPQRRPDLVALKLGYDAAEADVRAAIWGQFPAFSLGASGGSDTSQVVSVGPAITFDLPIFDRNQAKIASTRATRLQLHAEYQSRLDSAVGTAHSLLVRAHIAADNLTRARAAAASAEQALDAAESAYHQGNLDQRSLSDYQSTALDREVDVLDYEQALQEDALGLEVELGVGFPPTMIVPPDREETRS